MAHSSLADGLVHLLKELELLRRGVWLAEQREKHPSYAMELQAVLQTADLCQNITKELLGRVNDLVLEVLTEVVCHPSGWSREKVKARLQEVVESGQGFYKDDPDAHKKADR